MHSLLSICVDIYLTEFRLFTCLGKLPAEGLSLVMNIPSDFFAAQRSVRAVQRSYHITHMGVISPFDCHTKPYERAVGTVHVNLDFREVAFFPLDYT